MKIQTLTFCPTWHFHYDVWALFFLFFCSVNYCFQLCHHWYQQHVSTDTQQCIFFWLLMSVSSVSCGPQDILTGRCCIFMNQQSFQFCSLLDTDEQHPRGNRDGLKKCNKILLFCLLCFVIQRVCNEPMAHFENVSAYISTISEIDFCLMYWHKCFIRISSHSSD